MTTRVETLYTVKKINKKKEFLSQNLYQRAWQKITQQPQTLICFAIIVIYSLITLLGYMNLLPDFQQRVGESYEAPSLSIAKIFGTDIFGRSVL